MKLGVFADKGISRWLVQSFEPFKDKTDITLFVPDNNKHDTSGFDFEKHLLRHNHETWLSIKHSLSFIRRWLYDNEKMTHVDFYPFSLAEHFSSKRYDVILTKAERSLYTLASLKDRFGYKLVFRYPYTLPFSHIFNERSEFARRRSYDKIDHFICISETARKNLEYEGIDPSKIDVVLNSVDLSFFAPGPKDPVLMSDLGISADDLVIMFIGKLTSWKNPFTLLYASRPLIQKGLPVKIVLIGQGAQRDNLARTAKILGIVDRVIFLEFIENTSMNKYYNLADSFVMPSLTTLTVNEQFPFAVVEAMASGLPVIVSNAGGMPELIGDTGKIYAQGNYVELSGHLSEILTNDRLRETMAARSRERAEQMFDNRKNSFQILDVFKKLVKR
ncbi:MAG TPA: glycosyltransferase family 1 protein [Nitrospirae bacterium]|nr:D-inositol 3-phosphate glycosyltransferase [bacterium BMS3Abin10]GBE39247.1 D-inositol 3-phosphate glycosyltransferase [bacterium BMS3Bbin08]HDH51539.1 glycosyltransferase family 1 protein [Nitrospirota bacterium]HDK17278.1 glycosyltransferase family 1 protein [Nitrospirota bacterium]HDK82431.1 glycosyltransferase family 1 protein [Nitrospirota bacterium]